MNYDQVCHLLKKMTDCANRIHSPHKIELLVVFFKGSVVTQYKHIIVTQLFGHLHQETFRLLGADLSLPPLLLVSAVSPVYQNFPRQAPFVLAVCNFLISPPGVSFRVLEIDESSWSTVDAVTYFANLTTFNHYDGNTTHPAPLPWNVLHRTSQSYGLSSLTSQSLHHFAQRMLAPLSASPAHQRSQQELFFVFFRNAYAAGPVPPPVDAVTRLGLVCACLYPFDSQVQACVAEAQALAKKGGKWRAVVGGVVGGVCLVFVSVLSCVLVWRRRKVRRAQALIQSSRVSLPSYFSGKT